MEEIPTTEQVLLNLERSPDEPEIRSRVTLIPKVSELRWKLGRTAKQEPKSFYAHLQSLGLQFP